MKFLYFITSLEQQKNNSCCSYTEISSNNLKSKLNIKLTVPISILYFAIWILELNFMRITTVLFLMCGLVLKRYPWVYFRCQSSRTSPPHDTPKPTPHNKMASWRCSWKPMYPLSTVVQIQCNVITIIADKAMEIMACVA